MTFNDTIYSNPISPNQLCYNYHKTKVLFANEDIPISEDWLFIRQLTLFTTILKSNIETNHVTDHDKRTMNKSKMQEIAKWNIYTANYFVNSSKIKNSVKNTIRSHTLLLCSNFHLSDKEKKKALSYLLESIKYINTFFDPLFYKAVVKLLL